MKNKKKIEKQSNNILYNNISSALYTKFDGERYFLASMDIDGEFLCFSASKQVLKSVEAKDILYVDGKFGLFVEDSNIQLFFIIKKLEYENNNIPCSRGIIVAAGIVPTKQQESYTIFFALFKKFLRQAKDVDSFIPKQFRMDFEMSIIIGVEANFRESQLRFCQ